MNSRNALLRLRAFDAGRPLPNGKSKRIHVADDADILIVSFVRMGGESRPWGIAFGHPGSAPTILSVPEARNRDLVAGISLKFATKLLKHFDSPVDVKNQAESWEDLQPLRQLWLPSDTHLEMLHHLAYAFTWAKTAGDETPLLNRLGRLCGWLFREAQRPGQMAVLSATQALKESFAFPAEDVRQSHLGYLLAWLKTKGNYEARWKASREAEQSSVSTSLDPQLERDELANEVARWGTSHEQSNAKEERAAMTQIAGLLAPELQRRWELTADAIQVLRRDKRHTNAGVAVLVQETLKEQWSQYIRLERKLNDDKDGPAFFPSVETDRHPAAAASRYLAHQAAADLVEGLLVHDDSDLLAELIASGDAFRGEIVKVRSEKEGKKVRPIWTVVDKADRQLRLRPGSQIAAVGFKQRTAKILNIVDTPDGSLAIEFEITGQTTGRGASVGIHVTPPVDAAWQGRTIGMVTAPIEGISKSKASKVWKSDGPGAWLTHALPSAADVLSAEDQDDAPVVAAALTKKEASDDNS